MSLEDITIEPEEYEEYLKKAYKAATFKKPKNFLGLDKKIPSTEMEKLVYDNIQITNDDLRLLAINRATEVKKYLVETGNIQPERIFIIEPDAQIDQSKEKVDTESRVDLTIK